MKTAVLIDCPGEAHSNAYIDNCMMCAPAWGKVMCCPTCYTQLSKHGNQCMNVTCTDVGSRFRYPRSLMI